MSPPPSITSSNIAEAYAKWDKYVEDVDSEDEDERLRQENIDQHETYRKWQWEQKQQQKFDPMQAKRVNWENMGGNNSENRIKINIRDFNERVLVEQLLDRQAAELQIFDRSGRHIVQPAFQT